VGVAVCAWMCCRRLASFFHRHVPSPRPLIFHAGNRSTKRPHCSPCSLYPQPICSLSPRHAPLLFISFPTFFASILFENFPRLVHGHAIGRHRIGWRRSGGHRRTGRHGDPVAPQQEGHDAAVVNPERKQLSACESRGGGGRNPRAA